MQVQAPSMSVTPPSNVRDFCPCKNCEHISEHSFWVTLNYVWILTLCLSPAERNDSDPFD
jgi:hypothetical protein